MTTLFGQELNPTVAALVYVFLGLALVILVASIWYYWNYARKIERFLERDNVNNNMMRQDLVDRYANDSQWLSDDSGVKAACSCRCSLCVNECVCTAFSFVERGEEEWPCSICFHDNHPTRTTCIMCGTPMSTSRSVYMHLVCVNAGT